MASDLEAIGTEIDTLSRDFPRDRYFARLKLFKIAFIQRQLMDTGGDAGVAWAQAEEAETLCKPFLSDDQCVGNLIWCWAYTLGLAKVEDDEAFYAVMARLQTHVQAFPDSGIIPSALTIAFVFRIQAIVRLGNAETTQERLLALTARLETMARMAPDIAEVQRARVYAWCALAQSWAADNKRGLKVSAVARNVDAFTQPFPDHMLQASRLDVWRTYAFYESRYGVAPAEAERIARHLTWAAKPFHGLKGLSDTIALAWEAAVFGWHRDLREWASCERAIRRLEALVKDSRLGSSGVRAKLWAWDSLLTVHEKRNDIEAYARLEPEALDRVASACSAYPDDQEIAEFGNYIFVTVATSRHDRNADQEAIEEIANRIRAIVMRFPHSKSIRENADIVERLLLGLAAKLPPAAPASRIDAPTGASSGLGESSSF